MGMPSPLPLSGDLYRKQGFHQEGTRNESFERESLDREGPDRGLKRGRAGGLVALATQLPLSERYRVVDALVRSLTSEHLPLRIEKTAAVAGGEACLVRTRIAVWTLESYRRQGATDAEILEHFPSLRRADLESAWIYVREFAEEIEAAIRTSEDQD